MAAPVPSARGRATLDKGGGAGPMGNHFDNARGMEVVPGNGEVIRTGDGALDAPDHPNWHATKCAFGPALDGPFTRSNLWGGARPALA